MTFPNAFAGVKKIFNAHVLYLIAAILIIAGIGYIAFANHLITAEGFDVEALNAMLDSDTAVKSIGVGGAPVLVGCVLLIIAYIMELVGLSRAGKDEGAFRTGFWVAIISLVIGIALSFIKTETETISTISSLVSSILGIVVEIMIVKGVMNLATKLNRADMVGKGKTIMTLIMIALVASIVLGVLSYIFPAENATTLATIVSYCALAASLLGIVIFFMMLSYLGKAKKMLAEN